MQKNSYIKEIQKRGRYTIIPNELLSTESLDVYDKLIFSYIVSQPSNWPASLGNIARNLGLDSRTVRKRIDNLQAFNLIDWQNRKGAYPKVSVNPPSTWSILCTPSASNVSVPNTSCGTHMTSGAGHIISNKINKAPAIAGNPKSGKPSSQGSYHDSAISRAEEDSQLSERQLQRAYAESFPVLDLSRIPDFPDD